MLSQLRIFMDLATNLHFGRTSKQHHMSASTLSRVIRRLEGEVGAALFERNNRDVQLTAAGVQFRRFASKTLREWERLQQQLVLDSEEVRGQISLYCSVTASYSLLDRVLSNWREHQPGIDIALHTGDQALSLQRLLDGKDDMVIAAMPEQLSAKVLFQPLQRSRLCFIAPKVDCPSRHRLTEAAGEPSAALWRDLPWVLPESGLARSQLDRWFRQQRVRPTVYADVTGHEAIVSMVALGCGVGVVPELVITNSPVRDSIEALDWVNELTDFSIGLCTLKARLGDPVIYAAWHSLLAASR